MNEPNETAQPPAGNPNPWTMPPGVADPRLIRAYARAERRAARMTNPGYHQGLFFGLLLVLIGGIGVLSQLLPAFPTDLVWATAWLALGAAVLVRAFSR